MNGNSTLELLEILYTMVSEAWGVPLGNEKCIIERDRVLDLLDNVKQSLPTELAEARRLVTSRDEYITNAKREADSIKTAALERAKALVEDEEIVRISKRRSNEILTSAENRSRELYRVANEYVDDALRRTEEAVGAALDELRTSRSKFRAAAGAGGQSQNSSGRVEIVDAEEF